MKLWIRNKENKLSLHLRNLDDASHQLWVEAGKYVATCPNISISCGNTTMNRKEWISYLKQFDKEEKKLSC